MSPRITKLKEAIETMDHCTARHVASGPVIELFNGEVAWDGVVETFELAGRPNAKRCHAWGYGDENGETQDTAALELPPVHSPETAAKVAIAAKSRSARP